jgi:hypothetical protein
MIVQAPMSTITTALPPLSISHVLPPFVGTDPIDMAAMSPYRTTLVNIATDFGKTVQRKEILRGLLDYREALTTKVGLTMGFQWLSGSFMEDIETLENRAPNDIDVVTFYYHPASLINNQAAWTTLVLANTDLFDPNQTKTVFHCDAYSVDMHMPPHWTVEQTRYWFGLFSHRRGGLWKGLAQIPLAISADDVQARTLLSGATP